MSPAVSALVERAAVLVAHKAFLHAKALSVMDRRLPPVLDGAREDFAALEAAGMEAERLANEAREVALFHYCVGEGCR